MFCIYIQLQLYLVHKTVAAKKVQVKISTGKKGTLIMVQEKKVQVKKVRKTAWIGKKRYRHVFLKMKTNNKNLYEYAPQHVFVTFKLIIILIIIIIIINNF